MLLFIKHARNELVKILKPPDSYVGKIEAKLQFELRENHRESPASFWTVDVFGLNEWFHFAEWSAQEDWTEDLYYPVLKEKSFFSYSSSVFDLFNFKGPV